jgi:hypothetical protein
MNKKLLYLLVIVLLLASCNASIQIKDHEGWEIFMCGWALDKDQVLIQSHDGYVLNERFYKEHIDSIYKTDIEERTVEIENRLDRHIDVKLTYGSNTPKWIQVDSNSSFIIDVGMF